ncbi:MAG: transposase [Acidobacteriota bacterium]
MSYPAIHSDRGPATSPRARPTRAASCRLPSGSGASGRKPGHKDRHQPLTSYCLGLLLPGERKSVEPMAARLAPNPVSIRTMSGALINRCITSLP